MPPKWRAVPPKPRHKRPTTMPIPPLPPTQNSEETPPTATTLSVLPAYAPVPTTNATRTPLPDPSTTAPAHFLQPPIHTTLNDHPHFTRSSSRTSNSHLPHEGTGMSPTDTITHGETPATTTSTGRLLVDIPPDLVDNWTYQPTSVTTHTRTTIVEPTKMSKDPSATSTEFPITHHPVPTTPTAHPLAAPPATLIEHPHSPLHVPTTLTPEQNSTYETNTETHPPSSPTAARTSTPSTAPPKCPPYTLRDMLTAHSAFQSPERNTRQFMRDIVHDAPISSLKDYFDPPRDTFYAHPPGGLLPRPSNPATRARSPFAHLPPNEKNAARNAFYDIIYEDLVTRDTQPNIDDTYALHIGTMVITHHSDKAIVGMVIARFLVTFPIREELYTIRLVDTNLVQRPLADLFLFHSKESDMLEQLALAADRQGPPRSIALQGSVHSTQPLPPTTPNPHTINASLPPTYHSHIAPPTQAPTIAPPTPSLATSIRRQERRQIQLENDLITLQSSQSAHQSDIITQFHQVTTHLSTAATRADTTDANFANLKTQLTSHVTQLETHLANQMAQVNTKITQVHSQMDASADRVQDTITTLEHNLIAAIHHSTNPSPPNIPTTLPPPIVIPPPNPSDYSTHPHHATPAPPNNTPTQGTPLHRSHKHHSPDRTLRPSRRMPRHPSPDTLYGDPTDNALIASLGLQHYYPEAEPSHGDSDSHSSHSSSDTPDDLSTDQPFDDDRKPAHNPDTPPHSKRHHTPHVGNLLHKTLLYPQRIQAFLKKAKGAITTPLSSKDGIYSWYKRLYRVSIECEVFLPHYRSYTKTSIFGNSNGAAPPTPDELRPMSVALFKLLESKAIVHPVMTRVCRNIALMNGNGYKALWNIVRLVHPKCAKLATALRTPSQDTLTLPQYLEAFEQYAVHQYIQTPRIDHTQMTHQFFINLSPDYQYLYDRFERTMQTHQHVPSHLRFNQLTDTISLWIDEHEDRLERLHAQGLAPPLPSLPSAPHDNDPEDLHIHSLDTFFPDHGLIPPTVASTAATILPQTSRTINNLIERRRHERTWAHSSNPSPRPPTTDQTQREMDILSIGWCNSFVDGRCVICDRTDCESRNGRSTVCPRIRNICANDIDSERLPCKVENCALRGQVCPVIVEFSIRKTIERQQQRKHQQQQRRRPPYIAPLPHSRSGDEPTPRTDNRTPPHHQPPPHTPPPPPTVHSITTTPNLTMDQLAHIFDDDDTGNDDDNDQPDIAHNQPPPKDPPPPEPPIRPGSPNPSTDPPGLPPTPLLRPLPPYPHLTNAELYVMLLHQAHHHPTSLLYPPQIPINSSQQHDQSIDPTYPAPPNRVAPPDTSTTDPIYTTPSLPPKHTRHADIDPLYIPPPGNTTHADTDPILPPAPKIDPTYPRQPYHPTSDRIYATNSPLPPMNTKHNDIDPILPPPPAHSTTDRIYATPSLPPQHTTHDDIDLLYSPPLGNTTHIDTDPILPPAFDIDPHYPRPPDHHPTTDRIYITTDQPSTSDPIYATNSQPPPMTTKHDDIDPILPPQLNQPTPTNRSDLYYHAPHRHQPQHRFDLPSSPLPPDCWSDPTPHHQLRRPTN